MSQPEMIFTMGLPAAGKSTVSNSLFPDARRIDCDDFKSDFPGYNPGDPDSVQAAHAYSKQQAERLRLAALDSGTGRWVVDKTGTNVEKMVRLIREAQDAGFVARILFVTCTLDTSLRRNAARDRVVPESVIRDKADDIETAFELVAPHADDVLIVDNDRDLEDIR